MTKLAYREITQEIFSTIISEIDILLVTATELEAEVLHKHLEPFQTSEEILMCYKGSLTYYLACFGKYSIVHVRSGMGSILRNGSIMTISEALNQIKPKLVFMIGIAFGVNNKKQNIGDVLISESIIRYNFVKYDNGKKIYRANIPEASKILLDRFANLKNWKFVLPYKKNAKLISGPILSGEELINDFSHRNDLLASFPLAKGGEMEGAGLYAACDRIAEWILVKGICDFADGKKDKKKETYQMIAMNSAVSACLNLFNSDTAFNDFGLSPKKRISKLQEINTHVSSQILFEVYDTTKEEYYLIRSEDLLFTKTVNQFGLWLFGTSGCGKSSVILRNLLISNKDIIQINLAGCVRESIDEFFKVILSELFIKLDKDTSTITLTNFNNTSKLIVNTLLNNYRNKEFYLVIEEIPIGDSNNYEEFTEKLVQLVIYKQSFPELNNVKIILSSINNPLVHIKPFQSKIKQYVKFIGLKIWDYDTLTELIDKITLTLNINLSAQIKSDLITNSDGSPRFIKAFFRNLIMMNNFTTAGYISALSETIRDK